MTALTAYEIHQPACVLIVRHHTPSHIARLSPTRFRALLKGRRGLWKARDKGALTGVVEVLFDPDEPDHRVETDCIGRPVLIVGAQFLMRYWLTLSSDRQDRWFVDVAADLIERPDIGREAADAMARLVRSYGVPLVHS